MEQIRILLTNPHPMVRGSVRRLLERRSSFLVIGEAANGSEALMLCDNHHPDVVVLDARLPDMTGLALTRDLARQAPGTAVVFLNMVYSEEYVVEVFKAGALGYVLASTAEQDLVPAVKAASKGSVSLSPVITSQLIDSSLAELSHMALQLTDYERRLLCLLAQGQNERDLAQSLQSDATIIRSSYHRLKDVLQGARFLAPIFNSLNAL